jgi:hypothetical protein
MEFFRHCPGCGRRFHIKLEGKKLVFEHRESIPRTEIFTRSVLGPSGTIAPQSISPTILQEGELIIIDIDEFQYTYKCKHCGHEWSEKHVESRRES